VAALLRRFTEIYIVRWIDVGKVPSHDSAWRVYGKLFPGRVGSARATPPRCSSARLLDIAASFASTHHGIRAHAAPMWDWRSRERLGGASHAATPGRAGLPCEPEVRPLRRDVPLVVRNQSARQSELLRQLPGVCITTAAGTAGWSEAVWC